MERDTSIQVQILDKAVCISHTANTIGKSRNPIIIPVEVLGKYYIRRGIHNVMVTVIWKGHINTSSNPGQGCLYFPYC